jgi:hypothetical protein
VYNKNFVALMYRMTRPIFLGGLIQYFGPNGTISHSVAVGYAACIVASTFISVLFYHAHNMSVLHLGMKMRVGLCSLVYRKVRNIKQVWLGTRILSSDRSLRHQQLLTVIYVEKCCMKQGPIPVTLVSMSKS